MPERPRIFVSYNRSDTAVVEPLAEQLKDSGFDVFLDVWDLRLGVAWPNRLEERIADADSLIVVLGPHGLGGWQQRECHLALDRQVRDPDFSVIPVLIPGLERPALGFLSLNTWIDLRTSPEAEMKRLIAALGGSLFSGPQSDPRRDICPYRGLEAFREEDAPFFFGRETFAARLLDRIHGHRFVVVVGPSGSGKSSIVHAGLAPKLRASANPVWDITGFRPGADPLMALIRAIDPPPPEADLAETVRRMTNIRDAVVAREISVVDLAAERLSRSEGASRLLLVVDQFEEYRTLCKSPESQKHFAQILIDLTQPEGNVSVVATLRSDFYSLIAENRGLLERVEGGVLNVSPLSRDGGGESELVQAIRRPAEAVGLSFEDGLVERIISDIGESQSDLPLLEYLLTELWRERSDGRFTHAAYESLGGVARALAGRAETAYRQLAKDDKAATRRAFLSLVRPGSGSADTRVRASYPKDPAEKRIVDHFAGRDIRLLVTGEEPTEGRWVDMVHEALLQNWDRLKSWVNDARETLHILDRVRMRARRWQDEGRAEDLLLPSGLELEEGRRLLDEHEDLPIGTIAEYVRRSIVREENRIAEGRARVAEERSREVRSHRQKRNFFLAAFMTTAAFLAVALYQWWTAVGLQSLAEAEQAAAVTARLRSEASLKIAEAAEMAAAAERIRAETSADLAIARGLASEAVRVMEGHSGEISVAAMLATDSLARRPTLEGRSALREILTLGAPETSLVPTPWPGARLIVSGDQKRAAIIRSFNPDGLAVTSQLLELDSEFDTVRTYRIDGVPEPVYSPDGRWLVAGGGSWRLRVYDGDTGEIVLDHSTRGAVTPVFSPDSEMLYGADEAGTIHRFRTDDWSALPPLSYPAELAVRSHRPKLDIAPDGGALLLTVYTVSTWVINPDTGETRRLPVAPDDIPDYLSSRFPSGGRVTHNGKYHLAYDNRGGLGVFDAESGDEIWIADDSWSGRLWGSQSLAFSTDGGRMVSGGWGGATTVRDVASGEVLLQSEHGGFVRSVAFLDDGRFVSAGEGGAFIRSLDGAAKRCGPDVEILALAVDAVRTSLVVATNDARLIRCDLVTGAMIAEQRFDMPIKSFSLASNGRLAVTLNDADGWANWTEMSVIERESGDEISHILWNGGLTEFTLNHDGSRIAATSSPERMVRIWNVATGKVETEIPDARTIVGFGPDGRTIRIDARGQRIVDVATGQTVAELGQRMGLWSLHGRAHSDMVVTRGDGRETDYAARVWDLGSMRLLRDSIDPSTVAPQGSHIAVRPQNSAFYEIREAATGRLAGTVHSPSGSWISEISPDGTRVLVHNREEASNGSQVNVVHLVDVHTGARLATRRLQANAPMRTSNIPGGQFLIVSSEFEPEPKTTIEILDPNGEIIAKRDLAAIDLTQNWSDEDGRWLLLSTRAGLELLDPTTGKELWSVASIDTYAAELVSAVDLIAVVDGGSRILILDPTNGRIRHEWPLDEHAHDIAVASDGRTLLAAVSSDTWSGIRTFDLQSGVLKGSIELGREPRELHTPANPQRVLVRDADSAAFLLDLGTGEKVFDLHHSIRTQHHAYASAAPRAATASGSSVSLWDTDTGAELARREALGGIRRIAIGPKGHQIYYLRARAGDTQGEADYEVLEIWNSATDQIRTIAVEGPRQFILSPIGAHLAITDQRGAVIRVFDAERLVTVMDIRPLRRGEFFGSAPVAFTENGRFMTVTEQASYGSQQRRNGLRVFDLSTESEVVRMDIAPYSSVSVVSANSIYYRGVDQRLREIVLPQQSLDLVFSGEAEQIVPVPGTSKVVKYATYGGAQLIDFASGETQELVPDAEEKHLRKVAAHPDGRYLALSLYDTRTDDNSGWIEIYDIEAAQVVAVNDDPGTVIWTIEFLPSEGDVLLAQRKGGLLASPEHSAPASVWNWRTGASSPLGHGTVGGSALSPDGKSVALMEGIYDWDTQIEHAPRKVDFYRSDDLSLQTTRAFTLHSPRVLVANGGRRAALFAATDPTSGEVVDIAGDGTVTTLLEVTTYDRANNGRPIRFLEDGARFILGEQTGARIYDLDTGEMVRLTEQEIVQRWAVSADGTMLATAGKEFVSVWDLKTHEQLFRMPEPGVDDIAFAGGDGRRLAILSARGLVLPVWDSAESIARACDAFARDLWVNGRARSALTEGLPTCTPELVGR